MRFYRRTGKTNGMAKKEVGGEPPRFSANVPGTNSHSIGQTGEEDCNGAATRAQTPRISVECGWLVVKKLNFLCFALKI
jgi:hypothetical protein